MKPLRFCALALSLSILPALSAADDLSKVKTQADLDAFITAASSPAIKAAAKETAAAILAAADKHAHVEAVIQTIDASPGKFEKINTTPESLKKATGADVPLFDTLRAVDLSIPNAGPHDARKVDPYDAAFFEHLGHITDLESLYIIATKANDTWIAPLGQLTNLKSLRFVNNGKLSDAGLEHLAGLKQLESFSYVGTAMQGRAFEKFIGWNNLKNSSYRGSSLDDEGLHWLCERFTTLESLSLAHAKFTDAAAPNLAKLTKLKGIELGTHNGTPKTLQSLAGLPIEYLQLGEGFDSPECIPLIKGLPIHRLTVTNAKAYTPADVKQVAELSHLESLEFSDLPENCIPELKAFTSLKQLRLVHRPKPYAPEIQEQIKTMLPKTALKFE